MNAPLRRVAYHRAQVAMNERFPANEEQVANVIAHTDIDDVPRLSQCDAATLLWVKPIHREAAEIAARIANVGDGELQITRTGVFKNLFEKLERTFSGP